MRRLLHSQWVSIVAARQEHCHYWWAGGSQLNRLQTNYQARQSPLPLYIQLIRVAKPEHHKRIYLFKNDNNSYVQAQVIITF